MTAKISRRAIMQLVPLSVVALGAVGCQSGPAGLPVEAAKVPVGGGYVLPDAMYVVTQPNAGEYHAFQKFCPHAGCPVAKVDASGIVCNCHGSVFSPTDGTVRRGPATKPLSGAKVNPVADKLYLSV